MKVIYRVAAILRPYIPFLLRVGLGFVFLWSGLSKLGADNGAIGVCTNRAEAIDFVKLLWWLPFDPEIFILIQSCVEVVLGVMFIIGWWVELGAAVVAVLFIFLFTVMDFSLIWKNVGLLAATLALWGSESRILRVDKYWYK